MAFMKPQINVIKPDIANLSIYLRSTKKFGKTTLFRDVILEKYGDPSYGLLIGCGDEVGYKLLDNLNYTQVTSWGDIKECVEWLITKRGEEHNIKIVAFDTGDELVGLADRAVIALHNKENPNKKVRSIKAALGGFTAGEKYSANQLIKPVISLLQREGFGVWVIAHTKLKTIKDKGGLEEDGYQQLTSNLSADYEAAFGDCMDVCLTGVIDRELEEHGDKKIVTDSVRKLYFRGTPIIDAGGRFADGTVPEFLTFDKPNMAKDFITICENGMEKSKLTTIVAKSQPKVKQAEVKVETKPIEVVKQSSEEEAINFEDDVDEPAFVPDEDVTVFTAPVNTVVERLTRIRSAYAKADKVVKTEIKTYLLTVTQDGKLDESLPDEVLTHVEGILGI